MEKRSKIYIAGHNGLVGSAIYRYLKENNYTNIISFSHNILDLTKQDEVNIMFKAEKPEYVFLTAAKVGGIKANDEQPADFAYINMQIQNNIIYNAYKCNVKKLLFLGSSCIYPKYANIPIKEEALLTNRLEPTNKSYAIAKIAGITLCQSFNKQYGTNFISIMPTNLYGINDKYDLNDSHVIPALIRKFHEAKVNSNKQVVIWGDGTPMREFLYVDDLADCCIFLMNNYNSSEIINVGSGNEVTIDTLATIIAEIVGFKKKIIFDKTKPNGTPRKLLDCSKLKRLGWRSKTSLYDGLCKTYEDFLKQYPEV